MYAQDQEQVADLIACSFCKNTVMKYSGVTLRIETMEHGMQWR
jgi:hypothetical protein